HGNQNPVIPTKVGIQNVKSKETVFPDKFLHRQLWIPACAGMTGFLFLIFCFCRNDGMWVFVRRFSRFAVLL
ncbi:hypothetical protein M5099_10545, partial [Neisseria meningitidis]|uniref:hypothetical protein n=2 Tax=Neisseria meningitidis TaxID=487 RepID=UPI001959AC91